MADYLMPCEMEIPINLAKFIVKIQTRMIKEIKTTFKQKYNGNLICDSCMNHECNQPHLLECPKLLGKNEMLTYIPNYQDIFEGDLREKNAASGTLPVLRTELG